MRGPSSAFAACGGPRRGRLRQWRGSPGAAVVTPPAPSPLPSAAAAALGDAPSSCAGATPRVGGVPGAAVGAAAWLAGAAVCASRASGAPYQGGATGLAAWAAGAVASAGSGSWAGGGGLASTAASASLRSSRSAGVTPSTPARRGSGSGTCGGGDRPAGGSHRSLRSLLSW